MQIAFEKGALAMTRNNVTRSAGCCLNPMIQGHPATDCCAFVRIQNSAI